MAGIKQSGYERLTGEIQRGAERADTDRTKQHNLRSDWSFAIDCLHLPTEVSEKHLNVTTDACLQKSQY